MDESGLGKNKDEKVCCVAGFIAQNSAWRGFSKNWGALLERFGLDEFKAKEFWDRRPDGSLCGKYADWSFDRANDFIARVVQLIVSYRLHLLASVVKLPDFFSYTERQRNYLTGAIFRVDKQIFITTGKPKAAYFVPFNIVMIKGLTYAEEKREVAHFVFDEQNEFSPKALDRIKEMRASEANSVLMQSLGDAMFSPSVRVLPLQCADLAAFVCKEYYKRRMFDLPIEFGNKAVASPLEVMKSIVDAMPDDYSLYAVKREQMDTIISHLRDGGDPNA